MIGRMFELLETRVSGASLGEFSAGIGEREEQVEAVIDRGVADGIFERWPFWPERIRATGSTATPFLQDLARLRSQAWPFLERISEASGWPATLHLLVRGAHAVVERFPWDGEAEAIAREQSRYSAPRSLRSGATAMAIVAHMPETVRTALLERHALKDWTPLLDEVRAKRFCLRPGGEVQGAWILSAPLCAADGIPYGALCTYGFADRLSDAFVEKASIAVAEASSSLSRHDHPIVAERAKAIVEALQNEQAQ